MPRKSIVLIVDGLRASWLGPYGNTWFDTPVANALAADATLFQSCLINGPELDSIYRHYWHGRPGSQPMTWGLPQGIHTTNSSTAMITDDPQVADLAVEANFGRVDEPPELEPGCSAVDIASMACSMVVGTAIESLPHFGESYCCWVHMQGLAGFWDAPLTLRESLAEQEEAEVPTWVRPPEQAVEGLDPDVRFSWLVAAAAQVQAIDQCLGLLWEVADREGAVLIVAGARGYPLGEHGRAGLKQPALHGELLHVPLMVREPASAGACRRVHSLVQCDAIGDLLLRWHQGADVWAGPLDDAILPRPESQLAVSRSKQEIAIRTAAWFARVHGESLELYSKPDDQFEMNEVADRCVEETEAMMAVVEAVQRGVPLDQIELPELLWHPIR